MTGIPTLSPGYRLQHEAAQDCWVLLYPEGMVKLNPSAAEILKRCDGKRDITQIIEQLEKDFDQTGLANDVISFVKIAADNKWIIYSDG